MMNEAEKSFFNAFGVPYKETKEERDRRLYGEENQGIKLKKEAHKAAILSINEAFGDILRGTPFENKEGNNAK